MALVVQDYYDLVRLLNEHPEWRAELRRIVLSDELLALPEIVRELAEAQQRTEARVAELTAAQLRTEARLEALTARVDALAEAQQRTEARVAELTAAQLRTEARLEALTARVDALAEAQQRTEARLEALTARIDTLTADVRELTATVRDLAEAQRRIADRLGQVMGDLLELRYREHAAGYFGCWLRRARAVPLVTIEESLEAALSREDVLDVLRLDLLVNGRWLALPDAPEVWLAAEVAAVLNEADVARAWRRAMLLRRAGYRVLPIVAGEQITQGGEASARAQNVGIVKDGLGVLPAEAEAVWFA